MRCRLAAGSACAMQTIWNHFAMFELASNAGKMNVDTQQTFASHSRPNEMAASRFGRLSIWWTRAVETEMTESRQFLDAELLLLATVPTQAWRTPRT